MAFNDTFERLERLAYMIQRKSTGTPEELARKLGVSVRTVSNLLDQLRNWGADIEYCRVRCSYYYAQPVELSFTVIKMLHDSHEIRGGMKGVIQIGSLATPRVNALGEYFVSNRNLNKTSLNFISPQIFCRNEEYFYGGLKIESIWGSPKTSILE